ncbi:MAG: APC family permease [Pyrinomonadaceae bacterium]|nr:APC family permease [Pyrinomonadaceae bacterium]MCX7639225.1 APC family permease [Pyrinomonadaceae bacterium]MDW8303553.1 APC family permease [Acidobacteriota bacterium]
MSENLKREIGRWSLTAIAINTIIGAGIFGLPAKAFEKTGSWSLLLFVFCAFVIAIIVLCFAEVSSRFQQTGGMYLYAKEAFGSTIGFEIGWLYWLVRITTFAANCNLFLAYLTLFLPSSNSGFTRIALIFLIVASLTTINILGVKESVWLTNLFTIGKILPLLIFVLVGLFFVEPKNFSFAATPNYEAISTTALLLLYAFVGFEAAVIPAGETKNPEKNVPFALLVSLGFCTILFVLIQFVAIGTFDELAHSERPLADAAYRFMGDFGAVFIATGALISILGNLNGGFLAATRLPFAMAEQESALLPAFIRKTHKKFKTPYISILLTALPILFLTIQSSFISAVAIATVTRLLVYATTCLALPVFRKKPSVPKAQFEVPFGTVISVLSILLIIFLLSAISLNELINLLIFALLGFIILWIAKRLNSSI